MQYHLKLVSLFQFFNLYMFVFSSFWLQFASWMGDKLMGTQWECSFLGFLLFKFQLDIMPCFSFWGRERGTVWVHMRLSVKRFFCILVVVFIDFSPICESTVLACVQCITHMYLILVASDKFQNVIILSHSLCVLFAFKWKDITQALPLDTMWRRKTTGQFAGMPYWHRPLLKSACSPISV